MCAGSQAGFPKEKVSFCYGKIRRVPRCKPGEFSPRPRKYFRQTFQQPLGKRQHMAAAARQAREFPSRSLFIMLNLWYN